MTIRTPLPRSLAIVLGCGDIGSAVAVALHGANYSVVLIDEADPAWHRRGMALTDAWYVGNAELDGEGACFCASVKSIPSVLARRMIAATTWSWPGVASTLGPAVLVDTRGRRRRGTEILLGRVPMTIGIGRDFASGENVDMAIEFTFEFAPGADHAPARGRTSNATEPENGNAADGIVAAARHGRFMTERRIGESVRVGQIVGGLGNEAIAAPANGVLLGLSARGARIEPGDTLVEVDPSGVVHHCYGVGEGARRIAERVLSVLTHRHEGGHGPLAPILAHRADLVAR